jgi:hypothetical protein
MASRRRVCRSARAPGTSINANLQIYRREIDLADESIYISGIRNYLLARTTRARDGDVLATRLLRRGIRLLL